MMEKNYKFIVLILFCVFISFVLLGCGGNNEPVEVVDEEKLFIIARSNDAGTLDAGYGYSESEIDLVYHLYEGLVQFVDDDLNVGPALAETWDVSDDGTVWTFNLRQGVKFHDGTDFNADAVVFSFMRVLDESHPYYGLGDYSYFDYLLSEAVKDVTAKDEFTVEITLNEVFAPFLTYMGLYSQFIGSPTAVEKYGDEYFKNPVGTGPFKLEEWKRDEYIKITKFEDYWGQKPEIDTIVWKVVPEGSTRLMELQSGQVHAIKNVMPEQLSTITSDNNLEFIRVPGANVFYIALNHQTEPINNLQVRQAISHAIDFDKLVDGIYEGLGTRAINPMPSTIYGFNKDIKPYAYDPGRAKELLAEAGYTDGFEMDIHVFSGARTYIGRPVDAAEVMANDLNKVGIKATVVVNEWGSHKTVLDNYEHQFGLIGWFDVPYPSNFLKVMLLEGARTNYHSEELWNLANKALSSYDRAEQEKYYQEMQLKVHEDVIIIPVAHSDYTAAISKNVKGFRIDAIGNALIHNVTLED